MKNLYFLVFLFVTAFSQAQIVPIPDNNFKFNLISGNNVDTNGDGNYDGDVDTNGDNQIQVTEAQAVVRLLLHSNVSFPINTLEGIESFANLEYLESNNDVINADLSQNLSLINIDMNFNESENIILPSSSNLIEVLVRSTHLTSLDVSQNPNLENLNIEHTEISSLDVTQNPNLRELLISGTSITSIDLSQNVNLLDLFAGYINLTSLDVTQNPNLQWLAFNETSISEIDVTQNPDLRVFAARYCPLQSLDFTQNPLISTIEVRNTQLTSLDLRNGNNPHINKLLVYNNPVLDCIEVDDVDYAYSRSCDKTGSYGWCRGGNTVYSEDCNLGISDFEKTNLTIFPNPVQNELIITTDVPIEKIEIYNISGQLMIKTTNSQIDVSYFSKGLYFVSVSVNEQVVTKKLIKS